MTAALLDGPRRAFVRVPCGSPDGGAMMPTSVRVEPSTFPAGLVVAFPVAFGCGCAEDWRRAGYVAAFVACTTLRLPLDAVEFSIQADNRTGSVGGPSAGALLAVAMVAALSGAQPRSDTTMSATIDANGALGGVGDLGQKIKAAARDGVRRFGVARHQPMARKLRRLAARHGVELHELDNLAGAFAFLTDRALPGAPEISA